MTKQQEAEAIAKFLGWKVDERSVGKTHSGRPMYYSPDGCEIKNVTGLEDWLTSDAGTVAMIEKICKDGNSIIIQGAYEIALGRKVSIFAEAETPNAALQAAILEVMKNG